MRLTFFCNWLSVICMIKRNKEHNKSGYKYISIKNVQLQKYQWSNKSTMILSRDDCRLIQWSNPLITNLTTNLMSTDTKQILLEKNRHTEKYKCSWTIQSVHEIHTYEWTPTSICKFSSLRCGYTCFGQFDSPSFISLLDLIASCICISLGKASGWLVPINKLENINLNNLAYP